MVPNLFPKVLLSVMSGLSVVLRKIAFKLIFIGYFDISKCRLFVYYESIKRELSKRLTCECQCDVRLKAKAEGSTLLAYTRWSEEP